MISASQVSSRMMSGKRPLSKRQRECLELVAAHLDSQQIAAELGISPATVDRHIREAMTTLDARTRREAVRKLVERGEITGGSPATAFPPVGSTPINPEAPTESAVREPPPAPFEIGASGAAGRPERGTADDLGPLRTMALILAAAAAIVTIALALRPLVQNASDLANLIQPLHR
jgi:DNA-binding CsgD family transcriptional regulator